MIDKKKMIGNEIRAGSQQLRPTVHRANQTMVANFETIKDRRNQLIEIAADPPRLPMASKLTSGASDSPTFNQIAYSVLLIAILAAIAVGTSFINWAFLIYGILAVAARFPSTQMFVAALICLVMIPLTTSLQRVSLANTFSVMTFYFLVIGLVRACLELRRDKMLVHKMDKQA